MNRRAGDSSKGTTSQSVSAGVVTRTQRDTELSETCWRYLESGSPAFDPDVFDDQRLAALDMLSGVAAAGRGNTCFFSLGGHEMVLRHFRRGGMAQRISKDRYIYTGLERTRAMTEFSVLCELHRRELYVPKPYACRVVRQGAFYRASLVTFRLPGHTLAEYLINQTIDTALWESIGKTIAQFHREGVYHADLNTHNILIDSLGRIALIDFDQAVFRKDPVSDKAGGWRQKNLQRLYRSIRKVTHNNTNAQSESSFDPEQGYQTLLTSWRSALRR